MTGSFINLALIAVVVSIASFNVVEARKTSARQLWPESNVNSPRHDEGRRSQSMQYLKTASTQIRGVSVDRELKMNNSGKKSKKKRHRQGSKKGSDDSGDKKSDDVSPMFDLSDCASYSDAWLFELAATCSDIDTLAGCECPTVFALLETGSVHCAGNLTSPYACPSDCKVCQVCLVASGCATIYAA